MLNEKLNWHLTLDLAILVDSEMQNVRFDLFQYQLINAVAVASHPNKCNFLICKGFSRILLSINMHLPILVCAMLSLSETHTVNSRFRDVRRSLREPIENA